MNAPDGMWRLDEDERRELKAPHFVSPTGSLGLSLALQWKPGTIFVIINVYIDESGTHDADFMVMAGYAGVLGSWNRFDKKWSKMLRNFGISELHAKDMNGRRDGFRGKSPEAIENFRHRCVNLVDSHALLGFSVRLDRKDYQEHYVGNREQNPRRFRPDSMWGLCFRASLKVVLELIKTEFSKPGLNLNFIVDIGHKNSGNYIFDVTQASRADRKHASQKACFDFAQ